MNLVRTVRKLLRGRRWKKGPTFVRAHDELYGLTQGFCEADTAQGRTRRATSLFAYIWDTTRDRAFVVRLLRWIRMMEQDHELSAAFSRNWNVMVLELDSVTLFAEAGLPAHDALIRELIGRVFQRLLPSAREESDAGRIFADVFSSGWYGCWRCLRRRSSTWKRTCGRRCACSLRALPGVELRRRSGSAEARGMWRSRRFIA
jgi:hypothetical protein